MDLISLGNIILYPPAHTHTHTHTHTLTNGGRYRLILGRMINFFNEHILISITAYWMTVIHIPFTQLNVTAIGLGNYMIFEFALYPS
jgi:hypothetical protein